MDKYYMNPEEIRMTLDKMEIYEGKNLKTELSITACSYPGPF